MIHTFEAELTSKGPNLAWTHVIVPPEISTVFGSRGRVAVCGTLNGAPYRSSIMPEGDGSHYLNVTRALMAAAQARPGDLVQITMAVDREARTVDMPEELVAALAAHPAANAVFEALAYSHRKQYADWVASAKRAETRQTRASKAVERLQSSKPRFD